MTKCEHLVTKILDPIGGIGKLIKLCDSHKEDFGCEPFELFLPEATKQNLKDILNRRLVIFGEYNLLVFFQGDEPFVRSSQTENKKTISKFLWQSSDWGSLEANKK